MKYLNLGCGGARIYTHEWTNLDDLHAILPHSSGARQDLDKELNYVNFNVLSGPLPFESGTFDGVLASHFFEHFDAQQGLHLMKECHRILCSGGVLLTSVPDATYFRKVHAQDRKENWPQLFDTSDPANTYTTFFEAALWFNEHRAILTEDALWCYFTMAGFAHPLSLNDTAEAGTDRHPDKLAHIDNEYASSVRRAITPHLNRRIFSVEMVGIKP